MLSNIIKLIQTNGTKSGSGVLYTNLTDIEEIQKIVQAKLRASNKLDTIAYIQVTRSNLPAEKDL